MSPCDSIVDGPFMIRKGRHNVTEDWEPKIPIIPRHGYSEKGLANSINTISAKLIDKVDRKP
jgi:penicillin-binding protein 1A